MIKNFFVGLIFLSTTASSQVLTNSIPSPALAGSNVFLDASTNYSTNDFIGKGIIIPSVDLVNFEFYLNIVDGSTFPTFFDGFLVYNNATGTTINTGNRSSKATPVKPGFYYFFNPKGRAIFQSTGSKTEAVRNGVWKILGDGSLPGNITALKCTEAIHNGVLQSGTGAVGVTSLIPYTGGDGGIYNGSTINSTGVTGLTATLSAGNFAAGNGTLAYVISGTPQSSGTADFLISIGGQSCIISRPVQPEPINSLDCSNASNSGTLVSGIPANNVSASIPYTGGDGSAYTAQVVNSTGVTGLTATLLAGNFATGSGSLTYTITGTPSSGGTASFAINIGGKTCTLTRNVTMPITIPATITLAQNQRYFIASVFDQNYLPYTAPTAPASLSSSDPDATADFLVDVQGRLTTTGVNLRMPVTTTGNGTLPAYTQTITIPSAYTQDGNSRQITLSWASQAYTSTTKTITVNIKSEGGDLLAKKLDINSGIGNDYLGFLLGQFTYPYNNAGQITNYQVRDIPGIPDRRFGEKTVQGTNTTPNYYHNNLYLPIVAEDGSIWLNNNLGADYSDLTSPDFNLTQQAKTFNDYKAYGSSYQWGRYSDGHELMNWSSSTVGVHINGAIQTVYNTNLTGDNRFVAGGFGGHWRNPSPFSIPKLWQATDPDGGINNPCPSGFRLPTYTELSNAIIDDTSRVKVWEGALKLSAAGETGSNYSHWYEEGRMYYYTSSLDANGIQTFMMDGDIRRWGKNPYYPSSGGSLASFSVRCIKQ